MIIDSLRMFIFTFMFKPDWLLMFETITLLPTTAHHFFFSFAIHNLQFGFIEMFKVLCRHFVEIYKTNFSNSSS